MLQVFDAENCRADIVDIDAAFSKLEIVVNDAVKNIIKDAYEENIYHLADQMISIDLDDGVKVNYAKFQDVLAKIK